MKLIENKLRFEIMVVIQDDIRKKISTRIFNKVNRCLTVGLYDMGTSRYEMYRVLQENFRET